MNSFRIEGGFNTRNITLHEQILRKMLWTDISWDQKYGPSVYAEIQAEGRPLPDNLDLLMQKANALVVPKKIRRLRPIAETRMKYGGKERPPPRPDPCIEPPMFPVDLHLRSFIYQGISDDDRGRRRYLHMRAEIPPLCRFAFPPTVNTDYGWPGASGYEEFVKAPVNFRRCNGIMKSFFRKSDNFPKMLQHLPGPEPVRSYVPPVERL